MPLPQEVIDSVASTNFKNLGEAGAFYAALAMGNAVSNQQAMDQVRLAAIGSIVKSLTEVDPTEAVSMLKATTGNDLAQAISALQAAISSSQMQAKTAQTTPPTTP